MAGRRCCPEVMPTASFGMNGHAALGWWVCKDTRSVLQGGLSRQLQIPYTVSGSSDRERAVIECIIEGRSLRDAAKSFRVCDSTMQGDKRKLAIKIQEFMGFDILIEVRRSPRWKDSLDATREKMACREERKHGIH
jgi:hypothetical protein